MTIIPPENLTYLKNKHPDGSILIISNTNSYVIYNVFTGVSVYRKEQSDALKYAKMQAKIFRCAVFLDNELIIEYEDSDCFNLDNY